MQLLTKTIFGLLGLCSIQVLASNNNQFDYIGLNVQRSSYQDLEFSPQIKVADVAPLSYQENLSGIGLRGYIGHQFNRFIAMEAGLSTYGKADFRVTKEVTDADGKLAYETVVKGGFETSAGDLRVVGTYPFSESFYLKANLGVLFWNNEFTTLAGSMTTPETKKTSDNGLSAIAGVGVGYGFNNKIAVTLDFEQTKIASIKTQNLGLSLIIRI